MTPLVPDQLGYDPAWLQRELDRVEAELFIGSNAAFLAPLYCSMSFVWTNDTETAATDGLTVFWNPKDFVQLSHELRVATLIHEVWHPAGLCWERQEGRDPEDWNIAHDLEINAGLKKDGYTITPPDFIYDPRFNGMIAEEIYEIIHKERQCAPRGGGGSIPGVPKPGGQNQSGQTGSGGQQPRSTAFDVLANPSEEQRQQIIANVMAAANSAMLSGKPGDVPGHVQDLIDKIKKPVVPWNVELAHFCNEPIEDDYSWSMPDRRYDEVYMPSLDSEDRLAHLAFYFDVSGSVTQEIAERCFSEIHHIKTTLNPEKLTVVQFDTRITREDVYDENDEFNKLVIVGRGGTCLKPVREHMLDTKPTAAVVFSDLYVKPMEKGPKCPILWIAVGNRQATVPFGKLIHINP